MPKPLELAGIFLMNICTACVLVSFLCVYHSQSISVHFSVILFSWDYFSHDHARSRVYRWGEDGLLGITDRQCRLCFALALWNEKDPILKERLFGLTGTEGKINRMFCSLQKTCRIQIYYMAV